MTALVALVAGFLVGWTVARRGYLAGRRHAADDVLTLGTDDVVVDQLAETIWRTSRRDEGTISAMGAKIVAGEVAARAARLAADSARGL